MKFVVFQYFVFLFLLLCAELVVAVTTLVYREHFLTGLENRLMNRFKDDYGRDSIFTQAVEQAQFTVSVSAPPGLHTVFARVICSLFFLFWPLKNRGA